MSHFQFVTTQDGSLSLRVGPPETDGGESMHSLRGAFAETVYIYGSAIETALNRGFPPVVLSVGLGLGYVEILAAALALKHDRRDLQGESFELIPELREWFTSWLNSNGETPTEFAHAYDDILVRTAAETGVDGAEIKRFLGDLVNSEKWRIRGALDANSQFDLRFGCICFDAFSSKTSPDLWSEEFLVDLFAKVCAESCVLSTYACTGALKRSLKRSGFDLQIREGFSSKRDSTFALRPPNSSNDPR